MSSSNFCVIIPKPRFKDVPSSQNWGRPMAFVIKKKYITKLLIEPLIKGFATLCAHITDDYVLLLIPSPSLFYPTSSTYVYGVYFLGSNLSRWFTLPIFSDWHFIFLTRTPLYSLFFKFDHIAVLSNLQVGRFVCR